MTKNGIPMIVVAGTGSGVGKTSLTLGIVASLKRRGLRVQTFKVGPDYLDPSHLACASGRPCYNLDGWMTNRDYVEQLAATRTQDADVAVVEGVMGLYDGANATDSTGSTADLARWLHAPVLLVVNAHGAARSVAATVHGFVTFPDAPAFAGIVANRTGSPRHMEGIRQALDSVKQPPLLGAVPRDGLPPLASRHLGLTTATEETLSDKTLAGLADAVDRHVNMAALLSLRWTPAQPAPLVAPPAPTRIRVGIARDAAFHFYYPDNLELLAQAGVDWIPFSPIHDAELPPDLAALWLGGGYPEEWAAELSGNESMLRSVRSFALHGRPIYAECGGLMYLASQMVDRTGRNWPMTGVLPVGTRMLPERKRLGYAEAVLRPAGFWGPAGTCLRGHEFHYSELDSNAIADGWQTAYDVTYRDGSARPEGFWNGHILASYIHLHLASLAGGAAAFVSFLKGVHNS